MFVCLGFSLCYQRDTSFSHTWISVIFHVTFSMAALLSFWGNCPLSMHAVLPLFPVHAATQPVSRILQSGAPVEAAPWGWGLEWILQLNKRSLKATRYLHLPWGWSSWRHSFGSALASQQAALWSTGKTAQSLQIRSWVYPRISE